MARRINDDDRQEWISNVEYFYIEARRYRGGMRKYIRDHRDEIDAYINAELDRKPARWIPGIGWVEES